MDAYFPTAKIYNPNGQHYTSVDRELLLAYKESPQGQIIHVGINEAGALAAFTAVGTSYSTQGEPLIPVYVFYSMFGFQRTGDAIWAAGDQMARGFMIGATAGRTTLTGEGLQHADGHSPLLADDEPGRRLLRPGVRLRDRPHRAGRPRPHVRHDEDGSPSTPTRTSCTTSRSTTSRSSQPAEPEGLDVEGIVTRHLQAQGGRARRPQGPAARVRRRRAVGARGAAAARRGLGRLRRRLERHLAGASCAATASPPSSTASSTRTSRAAHAVRHRAALHGTEGPVVAVSDFMHAGAGPDPPVRARATTRRSAPTASASRTPAPPPAASSTSTAPRSSCGRCSSSPARARSTATRRPAGDRQVPAARRDRRHHAARAGGES